jgi:hypothetical protein
MDWGLDPERIAELNAIAEGRRFSARETEAFVLNIAGGGAQADIPLWDLLTVLFALGALTAQPRMGPRDAAIGCLLDQSESLFRPLRGAAGKRAEAAGARASAGPAGLELAFAGSGDAPPRAFAWSRIRMCLALGDFLFMSGSPKAGQPDGLGALSIALDVVFGADRFDEGVLKRAIQEPARFMRAWRRRHLPLQAFADLVREREAWLAARGRTRVNRDLDADDILSLWGESRAAGATWTYARFLEKLACLAREERMGAGRRSFMDAASIDDLAGFEPSSNPEDALLEWLDLARSGVAQDAGLPPSPAEAIAANDDGGGDGPYEIEHDGPELAEERSVLALAQLPEQPKMLTGEQRAQIAAVLGLMPLAGELPLAVLRAQSTREWENRIIEASRRGAGRAAVDTSPPTFDYAGEIAGLSAHHERLAQLVSIGVSLGAPGPLNADRAAGEAALRKMQRDRASFRIEPAELALIFARSQGQLLTVSRALREVARRAEAFGERHDLNRRQREDQALFASILAMRAPAGSQT